MTLPTNAEKAAVWDAYRAGEPVRTPVTLSHNPRIVVLDPELNTEGWTLEAAAKDPETHVAVHLAWSRHTREVMNRFTDHPTGLPDEWEIGYCSYNIYEAAALGAPVHYSPDSVPATEPFLHEGDPERIFEVGIDRPLELPFIRDGLAFRDEMVKVCEGMSFEGRPVKVAPWAVPGSDGPLTVACNVRGDAILTDLILDPDYANRLLDFIVEFAIRRRDAFAAYWADRGEPITLGNGLADDSVAMLSLDMYRERMLPLHARWYEAGPADAIRTMHLCGDAQRLLPTIARELGVKSFDTGFPIDHGGLREALGEGVEVSGGPEVALLLKGSADRVYERTREILASGIRRGGRFILKEGNNLPPRVPLENLEAMYTACLEHGRFDEGDES